MKEKMLDQSRLLCRRSAMFFPLLLALLSFLSCSSGPAHKESALSLDSSSGSAENGGCRNLANELADNGGGSMCTGSGKKGGKRTDSSSSPNSEMMYRSTH